mgnify:CR=1 FL=1
MGTRGTLLLMVVDSETRKGARAVYRILTKTYPEIRCELDFTNPLELLIATVLSAQCTDKRVNTVTPALFKKYKTPKAYAKADLHEIENLIHSTGFYHAKARNVKGLNIKLLEDFGGEVPQTLEELITLPGVGRKTANVVLNTAFRQPTMAVDTHIFRLSNRIKFAPGKNVRQVEDKLIKVIEDEFILDADVIEDIFNNPDPKNAKQLEKILIKRFKKLGGDPRFKKLSDRLEALRDKAEQGLITSIEFVKELCKIAKETLQAEKELIEEIQEKSPKAALTELFLELKTDSTPAVVERIVGDIDSIVRAISFPGWQHSNQGEREVQQALRKSLLKYKLHKDQVLFSRAYSYIKEYY